MDSGDSRKQSFELGIKETKPAARPPSNFLDICYLCKIPIAHAKIFLYKGEFAFCSEKCRNMHMEIDAANKKNSAESSSSCANKPKDEPENA